jgi:hypothetical protein
MFNKGMDIIYQHYSCNGFHKALCAYILCVQSIIRYTFTSLLPIEMRDGCFHTASAMVHVHVWHRVHSQHHPGRNKLNSMFWFASRL